MCVVRVRATEFLGEEFVFGTEGECGSGKRGLRRKRKRRRRKSL